MDNSKSLIEYLSEQSSGVHCEFRVVLYNNGEGYAHVSGRDCESYDFNVQQQINLVAQRNQYAATIVDLLERIHYMEEQINSLRVWEPKDLELSDEYVDLISRMSDKQKEE